MSAQPPVCDFGWPAPDFELPGIDGRNHRLSRVAGPSGTLVMFLSNHCPYVQAAAGRIVRDCTELQSHGVNAIAIMSNDTDRYPADSFANMKNFAEMHGYPFPYVLDATQEVARAYDAVCTPDFYGLNAEMGLQYRGRLDSAGRQAAPPDTRRELFEAMLLVAHTGGGPRDQVASIGCSIKWREAV